DPRNDRGAPPRACANLVASEPSSPYSLAVKTPLAPRRASGPGAARLVAGRWRLVHRLGEGADAVAWLAIDGRDGARVALKALKVAAGPARDRLRWEFAALAAIEHPNLVRVFDLGQASGPPLEAGQLFFTCELLDGEPLAARLA